MKEKRKRSIFNSHLDLARLYWDKVLQKRDWAIDATCGNGHDTLFLASKCEGVIGLDIQERALQKTRELLETSGVEKGKVLLYHQSHESFPDRDKPIRLIIYNLGYLPGGDKEITTRVHSTLKSLENALELILPQGIVSITCYPGHPEGALEESALLRFSESLSPQQWSVSFHSWKNRCQAPSLLIIQKN